MKAALTAASAGNSDAGVALRHQLAEERRKRANLVGAIEEGGENVSVLLSALKSREANIERLENELRRLESAPAARESWDDLPGWVERQLQDLHALLKETPERVKAEFRRLNLHLTFAPVDVQTDNPHYVVNGQCDLSALAFSFWARAERSVGAPVDLSREESGQTRHPDVAVQG